jgi:hypothetical protein
VGYGLPAAVPGYDFVINPYTGEIIWTPSTTGNWNATVIVKEFRNGAQIGEIRRDMQVLTVVDSTNTTRMAFSGTPALHLGTKGYFEYTLPANVPFHLVMSANDVDGDLLKIEALGGTFKRKVNPSTVTATSAAGRATATFDWTPSMADVAKSPYLNVFRGSEYHGRFVYIHDLTVAITVIGTTAVTNLDASSFQLSAQPNPTSDMLWIEATTPATAAAQLYLCDLFGRVVLTVLDGTLSSGKSLMPISIKAFTAGIYLLAGSVNGEKINTQKIVVQ